MAAELHRRPRRVHHRAVANPHGAHEGRPAGREWACKPRSDIADLLKPLGYVTGQFGKNHLGDRNEFLPTVHGFDEFFGNLYHLNAEEEPENPDYPKDPRSRRSSDRAASSLQSDATATIPTVDPSSGKVGKQTIENTGPLNTKRMETVDEEFTGMPRSTSSTASTGKTRRGSATSIPPACMSGRTEAGFEGQDRTWGLPGRHGGVRRLRGPVAQKA